MTLHLDGLGYTYPGGICVGPIDLRVRAGELVVLTGPTGCGKSTVLRLAAGLLQRHGAGQVMGAATAADLDPASASPSSRVRALGFVSQEPHDQLVAGTVGDELAFAPESAGWSRDAINARVAELAKLLDLPGGLERPTNALSGGQCQRLVVGAAMAARAPVALLDEPLAQLDPSAARALVRHLRAMADRGVAVLVVEHRLEPLWGAADRLVWMQGGKLLGSAPPDSVPLNALRDLGLSAPGLLDLEARVGDLDAALPALRQATASAQPTLGPVALDARDLRHSYGDVTALNGVNLTLHRGERVAILGGNGAGKSTLLRALASELDAGAVHGGRVVGVPQDSDLTLFCETVHEELAYGPTEHRLDTATCVPRVAQQVSVDDLLERAPQALSRGQRLRVAVGAALACDPDVLLLDEPTSGQDRDQVERLMAGLHSAKRALVFATHDVGLALRHATRVLLLSGGRVLADGPPATVLADLPTDLPLHLPALAAWCLAHDVPMGTPAELAARVR